MISNHILIKFKEQGFYWGLGLIDKNLMKSFDNSAVIEMQY